MEYKTVREFATDEFTERKSRFIGQISPCASEAEAQDFISRVSKGHHDAAHNVYAYILRKGGLSRCSDNGEPQGTAGVPVLDVLQKEGLTDVCVVVTRYFGGILLGAGGLVRAYSHGAKLAVDAAQVMYMVPCTEAAIRCDYSFYGKLTYMLPDFRIRVLESGFAECVTLRLLMRTERLEDFRKALTELSNGQVTAEILGECFEDME